jgi:hypothetical protein
VRAGLSRNDDLGRRGCRNELCNLFADFVAAAADARTDPGHDAIGRCLRACRQLSRAVANDAPCEPAPSGVNRGHCSRRREQDWDAVGGEDREGEVRERRHEPVGLDRL